MRKLITILRFAWMLSSVMVGTMIGAASGMDHHGWVGAIALGFVGLVAGVLLGSTPSGILQFLK
ncbi:hypothetical protein [Candidatus Phyllobacterium onerii]|uniref:hypothetical protein n=1 Tax=Candidatus Phyllobacterium onerii TaxID=3020828 RepID=UPI00232EA579|nr:hypothetical protein [Phyllobacterium sp. IY22]